MAAKEPFLDSNPETITEVAALAKLFSDEHEGDLELALISACALAVKLKRLLDEKGQLH